MKLGSLYNPREPRRARIKTVQWLAVSEGMVAILCYKFDQGTGEAWHTALILKGKTQTGTTLAAFCILHCHDWRFHKYKVEDLDFSNKGYRFRVLPTSAEEDRLIGHTCDACRLTRAGYKVWDRLLRLTPFGETQEQSLWSAGSVSPTQILILILRECMDKAGPAHAALLALNSQTALAHDLYTALSPSTKEILYKDILALTASYDYVHDQRDILQCVLGKKF